MLRLYRPRRDERPALHQPGVGNLRNKPQNIASLNINGRFSALADRGQTSLTGRKQLGYCARNQSNGDRLWVFIDKLIGRQVLQASDAVLPRDRAHRNHQKAKTKVKTAPAA